MSGGMSYKHYFIIISLVLFIGLSSAQDTDIGGVDDITVQYNGNGAEIDVTCDGSNCPPNEVKLRICDSQAILHHQGGNVYRQDNLVIPENNKIATAENQLKCTVGDQGGYDLWHTRTLRDDIKMADNVGSIKVEYSNVGNSGTQLGIARFHSLSQTEYAETFRMESEGSWSGSNPGDIRVRQGNCNLGRGSGGCTEYGAAKTGKIISDERTGEGFAGNINEMLENPFTCSGLGCRESPYGVAEAEWKTYSSNCDGECPLSHVTNGADADWIPKGEIIMGERFYSSDQNWPSGSVTGNDRKFHVCDSSVDSFTTMDGKNVYSPGDNFDSDYFECRDYQWIEREQCLPGYEWRDGDDDWKCYEKQPVTIDVNPLNVTDVEYQDYFSGYTAGIKIPGDEATKFETLYDGELQEVTVECWMGKENERPSDSSLKMQVTADVDGFRPSGRATVGGAGLSDIWVLGNLPYRDSATGATNNKTYSCVWGMNGEGRYGSDIYQGVNDFLVNSRDAGAIEMDVSAVRDQQDLNSANYESNVNWGSYSNDDRSGISGDSVNPFTSPILEYPYCPPINGDAKITCT